ncbi:PDZ domain-containing protein [Formosimonas limnophila]|nr:PDZ domain-containing protein [Formosimonas limnophila]
MMRLIGVRVFLSVCLMLSLPVVSAAPDIAQIVRTSAPSVVTVQAVQWVKVKVPEEYKNITSDPVYQVFTRVFGDGDEPPVKADAAPVVKKKTQGSGFIIAPNGVVLTNYHIVVGAHEIYVQLSDKRRLKATLLRSDSKRDMAVLKVAAGSLPALPMADNVAEGEFVLAVGANQKGVSAGVVRADLALTKSLGLLTDVDIDKSNTGGPLLNTQGEVLALNSNLLKSQQGLTRHVMVSKLVSSKDLAQKLPQTWQQLGFQAENVTEKTQTELGLPNATGAWVRNIDAGSPAARAGLLKGDVIVALESQRVIDVSDLSALRDFLSQGDEVEVTVWRGGDRRELRMSIPKATNAFDEANFFAWQRLGLKVRGLTPAQKSQVSSDNGVQIAFVQGAAQAAGLQAGDVLLSLNQQDIRSVEGFNQAAKTFATGQSVFVYVVRGATRQFVGIEVRD